MRTFFFLVLLGLVSYGGYLVMRSFQNAEDGCTTTAAATAPEAPSPLPPATPACGYVPDAETAVAIALAVWKPLYGKERIGKEKPYTATLSNGAWTVSGTPPLDALGGTAFARIARDDGRILLVSHGK